MSQIGIQIAKPEWEKNKDFIYYAQKIIEEIEEDAKNGGSGESQGGFDQHDFSDGSGDGEDGDEAGENATHSWLRKIVKRAAEEGQIMCKHAGTGHGDTEMFLGKVTLNQQIIDFINKIKIKANRIAQGQTSQRYTYGRMNKLWPDMGLPGKTKTTEYTEGCFFIADVSGSMWSPELLNQLLPVLEVLQKRKAIAGAYACDVKLTPFGNKIKGGGGTELGKEQMEQLCKMHGLKSNAKIDVVYATDGYCDFTEIEKMDNVTLHIIIIDDKENLQTA
ncbi:hypothetical protein DAPPUDRAFT_338619 [Daphnia pulex]|uniref:Uncharacterized protein n=1 Tax=Daphnia pulex TaxID=6669 RepID=E9I2Z7_DAPPU|nr:hypothetical protein DAPPUDRAFT_338619 [Daphnia pulex]|eukprot:EFX61636.1 hypothetical protein DAPPUDRAFT_338619 [Daphnia pulex]